MDDPENLMDVAEQLQIIKAEQFPAMLASVRD
jgi:hypothetical protein